MELRDIFETWGKPNEYHVNTMKSKRVTQERFLVVKDRIAKLAVLCNQKRSHIEKLGHQPRHKTFELHFVRCPTCRVFWDHSSRIVIKATRKISSSNKWGICRSIAKHQAKLRDFSPGGKRRLGRTRGMRDITRTQPTESTVQGSLELEEIRKQGV